jgi:hypothetical protein
MKRVSQGLDLILEPGMGAAKVPNDDATQGGFLRRLQVNYAMQKLAGLVSIDRKHRLHD